MKMDEVLRKARELEVEPGSMKKNELIRAIQIAEGNFPCYKTAENGICDQGECIWKVDCLIKE
jgi:hypothetical protein